MARIIINKEDLPAINTQSESYAVRYRLVSEDKNRFSSWSPIFNILNAPSYTVSETVVNKNSTVISIAWDTIDGVEKYDVWLKWGTTSWVYNTRTSSTSIVLAHDPAYNKISVEVYAQSSLIDRTQTQNFKVSEVTDANI
jgi:hypothetical protein